MDLTKLIVGQSLKYTEQREARFIEQDSCFKAKVTKVSSLLAMVGFVPGSSSPPLLSPSSGPVSPGRVFVPSCI
jgi:hypothetical protein